MDPGLIVLQVLEGGLNPAGKAVRGPSRDITSARKAALHRRGGSGSGVGQASGAADFTKGLRNLPLFWHDSAAGTSVARQCQRGADCPVRAVPGVDGHPAFFVSAVYAVGEAFSRKNEQNSFDFPV
ncbi:MAG: hypothetical protein OXN89_11670 [Bryobacterales bacterium]|nr:hypothetical protein [Bryobacterales bacterium]